MCAKYRLNIIYVFLFQRGIDNVYNGGALNLVSLVQLWNISLNMYKEQLAAGEISGNIVT